MKLLIATQNEAKIQGAKEAFDTFFEDVHIDGVSVSSDVPDEPINDQVMQGAENRLDNLEKYAKENGIEADFYLAIESGLINFYGKWINTSIALVRDKYGYESHGIAPGYPVPERYVEEIKSTDLSKLFTRLFSENELKEHKGGVRLLTHGRMTRADLIYEAFTMALVQIINGEIWH